MLVKVIKHGTVRPCSVKGVINRMTSLWVNNSLKIRRFREEQACGSLQDTGAVSTTEREIELSADDLTRVSY